MKKFVKRLFMKKQANNSIIYLNTPISNSEFDWIDVSAHVDSLKAAIKNNAKMIAVTSDFGSGKSSLIQLLEKKFHWITKIIKYKFCKINLWCHLDGKNSSADIHKTFLYQLTSQINPQKGSYINKKLNKNYGLLKIELSSRLFAVLGFVAIDSENIEIALDNEVYLNVYEKLVDGGLKSRYTRLHKKANKK